MAHFSCTPPLATKTKANRLSLDNNFRTQRDAKRRSLIQPLPAQTPLPAPHKKSTLDIDALFHQARTLKDRKQESSWKVLALHLSLQFCPLPRPITRKLGR